MEKKFSTDEELFAVSAADPQAFTALANRYQKRMLRIAFNICRSREISEEVVQEALLRIFLYRDRFEQRPDSLFRKWADRVLINTALNELRR